MDAPSHVYMGLKITLTGKFFAFVAATRAGVAGLAVDVVVAVVAAVVVEAVAVVAAVVVAVAVVDAVVVLSDSFSFSTASDPSSELTGTSAVVPSAATAPKAKHPAIRSRVDTLFIFKCPLLFLNLLI